MGAVARTKSAVFPAFLSWLGSAAAARALLSAFTGLLQAIGLAFDGDDLGVVDEAVDQRDDAGGVWEHLAPLREWAVGGDQRALVLIATRNQFEHQIGVAVRVGQIAHFVDHQQLRPGVMAQTAAEVGIAVERAEISKQLARAGEQHGVAMNQRLMGDILRQRRFANAIRADQDDVCGLAEEVERHQRLDGGPVAALGPAPIEVAEWLEATDMGGPQSPLQAAARALLLLPADQRRHPGLGYGLWPMRQQAMQMQRLGAGAHGVELSHRTAP